MADVKIPQAYGAMLRLLYNSTQPGPDNRTGELNRFGQVLAGGDKHLLNGDAVAWLWLMVNAYVEPVYGTDSVPTGRIALSLRGVAAVLDYLKRTGQEAEAVAG
jgi:hypothetical protein